ncbi:MAG: S9 family peptidase [Bacteroidetes bacterium]|nr:S9 family peptidase [Bacteroidota bacterium]
MKRIAFTLFFGLFIVIDIAAQKKPLDHTVYDSWERISERLVSPDGNWAVYVIDVQEGDPMLVIRSLVDSKEMRYSRGTAPQFSVNGRYLVFKIKPFYAAIREARIKKRKPEESPKDSLCIFELGVGERKRIPRVKSFKMPSEEEGLLAIHLEPTEKGSDNSKVASSLLLLQLDKGGEKIFSGVTEFEVADKGGFVVGEQAKNPKDSLGTSQVFLFNGSKETSSIIAKGGNDFRTFVFSSDGQQIAFIAEREARPKELVKYFKLYHYKVNADTAKLLVDRYSYGMKLGFTVSEFSKPRFSKSGQRLYFGTGPIRAALDTSLSEIDQVKVDIWHYNDDYLQTQQLFNLKRDLEKSYLAVYDFSSQYVVQLETPELSQVLIPGEGDGMYGYIVTDWGYRIPSQWTGTTKKDIYRIQLSTGDTLLIKKAVLGVITPSSVSPSGAGLSWYDYSLKQYVAWYAGKTQVVTKTIPFPLYDEEHDSPGPADPYGIVGWLHGDTSLLIYDRYDAWKVDVRGKDIAVNFTKIGRTKKESYRYVKLDPKEKYVLETSLSCWRFQHQLDKSAGLALAMATKGQLNWRFREAGAFTFGQPIKAKLATVLLYTKEKFELSPDLYVWRWEQAASLTKITSTNPQQKQYWWGNASLYRWKALNGLSATGVLYLPENFDRSKKYPLLLYFYETHTNTLHSYIPPAPTGSRLNISFYVSRGYVVLSPDIHYTIGYPAKSCYDYVVSAAKQLAREPWIDGTNIGIQGQSWGGIQVAQLVTMTNIFKAAWAGAPVANMTSAYGGIRWESGVNRQFQYEMTQSRIGATLWQRQDLYIKNSPLFSVPKITTPMVIMANDADGAVPWYQGIELFTAMRRLGKKVWMLNYNGEAHNLRERKNQKDISIRQQQYFDWLLKGERPARWITEGVPAINKGKDMGLDLVD